MIEPRVYRAAFLPAVLALVVAMFSLEDQPPLATPDLAADVIFEGDVAADEAEQIARRHPDRRAGTDGDAATAELVRAGFEQSGFDVEVDEFTEDGRDLRNVVATRTGGEREQIVVLAGRDADSVPDASGSATDTAALLQIAAALEGRAPQKTVVLVSVDGSTLGDAGARRYLETATDREHIQAVLVLSDLGAGVEGGPATLAWSNDPTRGSIGLERTADEALRRELPPAAGGEGLLDQVAHLAFPIGVGAQGVLLDEEVEAIRLSGSGLLPSAEEPDIDPDRVGGLGRATLQTVFAIDAASELEHGPETYVIVAGKVLPEWAVAILTLTLILPALIASVDALARARRRREPVRLWGSWLVARVVPFAAGLLVAVLAVVTGLSPNVFGTAPVPLSFPLDGAGGAALGITAATIALAWIFLRPVLARWGEAPADPAAPGAGCVVAVTVAATTVVVWILNPFAALALVPAAHLWALATLAGPPSRRARALMVAGGLALPLAILALHMLRLSLDPLEGAWYGFLLIGGGQVGLPAALVGCVLAGSLAAVVEIVLARAPDGAVAEAGGPALRGPGGYAGPGSLGGTGSALKR